MAEKNETSLEERIDQLEATLKVLQLENAIMKKLLQRQEKPDEPKTKPTIPSETFQVDKKEYQFCVASFVLNKETITAQDALTDKEILAQLVAMKSGVIREIV